MGLTQSTFTQNCPMEVNLENFTDALANVSDDWTDCIYCMLFVDDHKVRKKVLFKSEEFIILNNAKEGNSHFYILGIPSVHFRCIGSLTRDHIEFYKLQNFMTEFVTASGKCKTDAFDVDKLCIGTFLPPYQPSKHLIVHCLYFNGDLGPYSQKMFCSGGFISLNYLINVLENKKRSEILNNIFNDFTECSFCQIINENTNERQENEPKLLLKYLYEDETCVIFNDNSPRATMHLQCVPKMHLDSIYYMKTKHIEYFESILEKIKKFLQSKSDYSSAETLIGFRKPPFNMIPHLSFHILAPISSCIEPHYFKPNSEFFIEAKTMLKFLSKYRAKIKEELNCSTPILDCIFCKICQNACKATIVRRTMEVVVFKDIRPAATIHFQAIPFRHIKNINHLDKSYIPLLMEMKEVGTKAAIENGADACDITLGFHIPPYYSISHLHLHVLWPSNQLTYVHKNNLFFKKFDDLVQCLEENSCCQSPVPS